MPPSAPVAPPIPLLDRAPARPDRPAASEVILTGLRGEKLHLSDFHGREILLLFWDAESEACRRLEPDLKAWEAQAPDTAPELVVIVPGANAGNQVVTVGSRLLIDRDGSAATALGVHVAPTAIRLDADGQVAGLPTVGGQAVLTLLADSTAAVHA